MCTSKIKSYCANLGTISHFLITITRSAGFVHADENIVLSLFFDADAFASACAAFSGTDAGTDAGAGAFATAVFAAASASASTASAFPVRRGVSNCDVYDSLFFYGGVTLLFGSASAAAPFAAADSVSSLSFSCCNSCGGAFASAGGASGSTSSGSGSNDSGTDASASGASGAFVAKRGLRLFFRFD